jgi:hypothetical protein
MSTLRSEAPEAAMPVKARGTDATRLDMDRLVRFVQNPDAQQRPVQNEALPIGSDQAVVPQ